MKIRRNEKGITLVALIITIVVLLILAVVSISSIQEDGGLIGKANGAVTKWNDAQKDEQVMMNSYLDYLNGGNSGSGTDCSHVWTWEYQYGNAPSVCTTCGQECTHTGEYSQNFVKQYGRLEHYDCRTCYTCGQYFWEQLEECNLVNDTCTLCGFTCTHSWSQGVCTICGKSSADIETCAEHTWDIESNYVGGSTVNCTVCGYYCNHSVGYNTVYSNYR